MTTQELARAALILIERADLKGTEVPVYTAVTGWLQSLTTANAGLDQSPAEPPLEVPDDGE